MRRSPLKRRTPMKRGGRINWKSPRRLKRPGSDPAYLAEVRKMPCCASYMLLVDACNGPIDPHHAGRRPGTALKAPDDTAIPMCRKHHRDVECLTGPFRSHGKDDRRRWYDAWIPEIRRRVELTRAAISGQADGNGGVL